MGERLDELLRAIREGGDRELRLVYADALEEAGGHLRAELIRRSIAGDREWVDATIQRHDEVLAGAAIAEHARDWSYRDGLVAWLTTTLRTLAEHGSAMLRSAPVTRMTLQEGPDEDEVPAGEVGHAIGQIQELAQIQALDFFVGSYEPELLDAFMRSPHLGSLREVSFAYGDEHAIAEVFAKAPLPALRELMFWMESGSDGDHVANLIAGSELRQNLSRLEISGCEPSDEAIRAIASSPFMGNLELLLVGSSHYSTTRLGVEATTALAESRTLTKLTALTLAECGLDDESIAPLWRAAFPLTRFGAGTNKLTTIEPLVRAPCMAKVRILDLKANNLDDRAVDALLAWPESAALTHLDLSTNPRITNAARDALKSAPCLSNCYVVVS